MELRCWIEDLERGHHKLEEKVAHLTALIESQPH
ncbi:hypothetical protein OROMI_028734 [Orobanche minor]